MSCGKKTNLKNLLVKLQSADAWEAPAGTDNWRVNQGLVVQTAPEVIARQILKSSYTPEADLVGIKVATVTGSSELYGADYTDGVTKPWVDPLFQAGQLIPTKIEAIPVSAIASNFVYGEIVSGATGVGRVVVPTQATDTVIYVEVSVAGFTAESLTGSIAGSATATGAETDAGWSYKFDSTVCKRLSVQGEEDDLISQM